MDLNTLNIKGSLNAGVDQLIYSSVVAANTTSVTISGLTGNTDVEYFLNIRYIGNGPAATTNRIYLYPNGDTTAGHYGYIYLGGINTTPDSDFNTASAARLTYVADPNNQAFTNVHIYAKTGNNRMWTSLHAADIDSSNTVMQVMAWTTIWNESVTEITSLVIQADQANGIKAGTSIELYARRGSRS